MHERAPCELLDWDTDFFGIRIARVRGDTLSDDRLLQIEDWSRENRVGCLYFLARSGDPVTIRLAEKCGFRLVDIRVTLERRLDRSVGSDLALKGGIHVRPVCAADVNELQALARAAHLQARFFSDENFSREDAERLYSTWIALDCEGRAKRVLVAASSSDRPVGYISCYLDAARWEGQIGLIGVSDEYRGQGVGRALVLAACDYLASTEARTVMVVTQGANVGAQRLYEKCGFISRDLQLWYHKWYAASND